MLARQKCEFSDHVGKTPAFMGELVTRGCRFFSQCCILLRGLVDVGNCGIHLLDRRGLIERALRNVGDAAVDLRDLSHDVVDHRTGGGDLLIACIHLDRRSH